MLDRDPAGKTRGCFDRLYWSWKFTDFPAPRMQEGLYFLAFLYTHPLPGANLVGDKRLLGWIAAGFDFWARLQHRDGSFDEAYPFERSLAATAFTSFYVAEALALVETDLPPETARRVRAALVRAGEWLCRNDETHGFLSNHLAAAAAALEHAHRLQPDDCFAQRRRHFVDKILAHQSSEGWYDEYGGADPGYQTHGSFYLARLIELTGDAKLLDSLGRACQFEAFFVHPDGSIGGEYASRNTQTYYPAAFEMLSNVDGAASWIAQTLAPNGPERGAAGLHGVDPGNYFPLLNNYAFAYAACLRADHRQALPLSPPTSGGQFPKAGITRLVRGERVAYVGAKKGGVVKAFDRIAGQSIGCDCGYFGRLADGGAVSSQARDSSRVVDAREDRLTIEGDFYRVGRPVMTPGRFVAFRLFMLTVGRCPPLARWIKNLLVKVLINKQQRIDLHLNRTVELEDDQVRITDELSGPAAGQLAELRWADSFTTIHMGSSRYFVPHELGGDWPAGEAIDVAEVKNGLTLTRVFPAH
jgi:hypothetical protein